MTPTFAEAIQSLIETNIKDLRISLPAKVERYDAALQQCDVQPLIKEAFESETGERIAAQLPVLVNCPIIFPNAGGFRITFPVNVGDTVLLIFSASSLDVWLSTGNLVDPLNDRGSLIDAVAIPGLRSFKNPLNGVSADAMELGNENTKIRIEQDAIRLGTATGKLVALAEKVENELAEIKSKFNAHTHLDPVSGSTGTASTPLAGLFPSSVGANNVFAKE